MTVEKIRLYTCNAREEAHFLIFVIKSNVLIGELRLTI